MRRKSGPQKPAAEQVIKDIRRATRKHHSAEDKIRIVLEGLRGEDSIAALCRREGIAESLQYSWSKEFLEAGKKRLAGDTARAATSDEVRVLRRETRDLKEVVRQLVQKVVITATPGHQPAKLEVHGRIASILAAMEAASIMEERFRLLKRHEYLEKLEGGELEDEEAQKKLLDAYAEELSVRRLEWCNIQVSVVAGAGFEPAAFRL
jgi:transposase